MRKYALLFQILIPLCFLISCGVSENPGQPDELFAPTVSMVTGTHPLQIPDTDASAPRAGSMYTAHEEENAFIPKINAQGQYEVSNSYELEHSIGSNRVILIYPGEYTETLKIYGVSNLSIIGIPSDDASYVEFNGTLDFTGCTGISILNLLISVDQEWGGSITFTNSKEIHIEHCKINPSDSFSGLYIIPNLHSGSGLFLENVNHFTCSDIIIEGYNENIALYNTKNATFTRCTFLGSPIRISDGFSDYGRCENIVLQDCALLSESGTCATWSNYVPIPELSGYEIGFGTEEWSEDKSISAIMYHNQENSWKGFRFINTYDGRIDVYQEGKFQALAEKLFKLETIAPFPSLEHVFADNTVCERLVIHITEPEQANPDIIKMMSRILLLEPVAQEILNYNCPVAIAYYVSDDIYDRRLIAYAEFSQQSFSEFMKSKDTSKWEPYCRVIVPAYQWDPIILSGFFDEDSLRENGDIKRLFITGLVDVNQDNGYGQMIGKLCTIASGGDYYNIYAVESFTGAGDFMHYNTDLIIIEELKTNGIYIASDKYYKINTQAGIDKAKILNALKRFSSENRDIPGGFCDDVILLLESARNTSEMDLIVLSATENPDTSGFYYDSPKYYFKFFTATYDSKADRISRIDPIKLRSYKDLMDDIRLKKINANSR